MAPALVLLHGFTHSGASWNRVTAALGERYRPLAPDIRGHASAGDREPVTLEAVLDDVTALVPGELDLAGYSMGGRIALHAAFAMAPRLRRLTLIGASAGLAEPAQRAQRRADDEHLADELETMTIEAFAQRWAQTPVLAGLPDDVAAEVRADRLRSSPAGLARALRGLGAGALPSLWDRLGELTVPVTLVVGERDAKFRAIADELAAGLARAQVITVSGAGHAVHLEAPDRVAEALA